MSYEGIPEEEITAYATTPQSSKASVLPPSGSNSQDEEPRVSLSDHYPTGEFSSSYLKPPAVATDELYLQQIEVPYDVPQIQNPTPSNAKTNGQFHMIGSMGYWIAETMNEPWRRLGYGAYWIGHRLDQSLAEYRRMVDFSNSRPVVRFRNTKTEASLAEVMSKESGVDYKYKDQVYHEDTAQTLLEIWDPVTMELFTIDPRLLILPVDAKYVGQLGRSRHVIESRATMTNRVSKNDGDSFFIALHTGRIFSYFFRRVTAFIFEAPIKFIFTMFLYLCEAVDAIFQVITNIFDFGVSQGVQKSHDDAVFSFPLSWRVRVLAGVLRYRIAQNNITIQEIRSMDSAMIYQQEFAISAIIYVLTCGYLPLVTFVLLMIQWLCLLTRENSARFFGKVWSDSPVFFRNSRNLLRGPVEKTKFEEFWDRVLRVIQGILGLTTVALLATRMIISPFGGLLDDEDTRRRLNIRPKTGFFCGVEDDDTDKPTASPTLNPTWDQTDPNQPTPYPSLYPEPTPGPSITPKPTHEEATDEQKVLMCDNSDRQLMVICFAIMCFFLVVWLYRLHMARSRLPPSWKEKTTKLPEEEKVLFKVTLRFYKNNYVWNIASQMHYANVFMPRNGPLYKLWAGIQHGGTYITNILASAAGVLGYDTNYVGSITFHASKSAIDALHAGIAELSSSSDASNRLFTKYEHDVSCNIMDPKEGGPLVLRMLNAPKSVKRRKRLVTGNNNNAQAPVEISGGGAVAIGTTAGYAAFNIFKTIKSIVENWKEFEDVFPKMGFWARDIKNQPSQKEQWELVKCYIDFFLFGKDSCLEKAKKEKYLGYWTGDDVKPRNCTLSTGDDVKPRCEYKSGMSNVFAGIIIGVFFLVLTFPLWKKYFQKTVKMLTNLRDRIDRVLGIRDKYYALKDMFKSGLSMLNPFSD